MALSVDYLYQFALKLIRKNQAGGLSSLEFAYHWNGEQSAYHTDLLGRFQRSSNGKAGLNTGLIENQTIMTKLTPFITPVTLTIAAGISNKPADFCYELALRIGDEIVVHINHSQISSVKTSVIDPPSIAEAMYYCVEYKNYYSFIPTTVTSASLDYIASPVNVVWGYTFDVNGRQVYDVNQSTQPQWLNADAMEITKRMLSTLGVSFSSQDFENFGKSVIAQGQ
jgi:hypothetical protein